MVGACIDLTERKNTECELRTREQLYKTLVENLDVGVALIDKNRTILATNRYHADLVGCSANDCVGKKCFRINEKRERICPVCPITMASKAGETAEVEIERTKYDGTPISLLLRAIPIKDDQGNINTFIEVVEDITERKKSIEQITKASFCLEQAADSIFWIAPDTRFVYVNQKAIDLTGYTKEELLELNVFDIDADFPPEGWQSHWGRDS